MKQLTLILAAISLFSVQSAFAKCQYGSDWKKGSKKIVVCVNGDSFSDRKKAKEVCEKVKGSSCGTASTFSSSCSNNECYDASGKNSNSLSGY